MPKAVKYAFARSALRDTMSSAEVEKPRASIDPVSSRTPKTDSRYAASPPVGWKRTSARATAGISLGSRARQRNSSKKRSAALGAEGRPRQQAERGVVLVHRRRDDLVADRRREIEIDPLEQLARALRIDVGHQLRRARLQRDAVERRRVLEDLRALPRVGRNRLRRRSPVAVARGVGVKEGFGEELAL